MRSHSSFFLALAAALGLIAFLGSTAALAASGVQAERVGSPAAKPARADRPRAERRGCRPSPRRPKSLTSRTRTVSNSTSSISRSPRRPGSCSATWRASITSSIPGWKARSPRTPPIPSPSARRSHCLNPPCGCPGPRWCAPAMSTGSCRPRPRRRGRRRVARRTVAGERRDRRQFGGCAAALCFGGRDEARARSDRSQGRRGARRQHAPRHRAERIAAGDRRAARSHRDLRRRRHARHVLCARAGQEAPIPRPCRRTCAPCSAPKRKGR